MKKFLVLILSVLCLANIGTQAKPDNLAQNPSIPIIVVNPTPDNPQPKSPGMSDIYCSYSEQTACLDFTFSTNLGNLTITVVNTSSGEVVSATVDSSTGYAAIPISGDPGYYVISIVSGGGNSYYGSFTL